MTTNLMTIAELLATDAVIGRELDSGRRGRDLPPWTENALRTLLAERRVIRTELERRHVAANN